MTRTVLLERLCAEYLDTPDLCLTLDQAHQLLGGDRVTCQAALDALLDIQFLDLTANGYARRSAEATLLRRLQSSRTPLRVQVDRRRSQDRRRVPRGGRRDSDVEAARGGDDDTS
jgi:hypothetical protein